MDGLIYLMNLQYMYCMIFISQVIIIQTRMRSYLIRKTYIKEKHHQSFQACLVDIIELSYSPPIMDYLLLEKGGYNYREGLLRFNLLIEKI